MENNKKESMFYSKSFLVNVLYHVGFNEKAIRKIANVTSEDIKKQVVK